MCRFYRTNLLICLQNLACIICLSSMSILYVVLVAHALKACTNHIVLLVNGRQKLVCLQHMWVPIVQVNVYSFIFIVRNAARTLLKACISLIIEIEVSQIHAFAAKCTVEISPSAADNRLCVSCIWIWTIMPMDPRTSIWIIQPRIWLCTWLCKVLRRQSTKSFPSRTSLPSLRKILSSFPSYPSPVASTSYVFPALSRTNRMSILKPFTGRFVVHRMLFGGGILEDTFPTVKTSAPMKMNS